MRKRLARAAALAAIAGAFLFGCSGTGATVVIPPDVDQCGYYTVTCYDDFYGRWASGTMQEKVAEAWAEAGMRYEDGIATIDGRYLVACAETFGKVGDDVTFTLSDGTTIPCTIADQKSTGDPNYSKWGHVYSGKVNVIEFEVSRTAYESHGTNPGNPGWKEEWGGIAVEKAVNHSASGGAAGCSRAGAGGPSYDTATAEQKAIADAAMRVPSPGPGLCATWVSQVYALAGWPYPGGNACDMYYAWCTSSDRSELKVGMAVATPVSPYGAAGLKYGHIGIYVGDGSVMHSITSSDGTGVVATDDIDDWIAEYGASPKGVRWGFPPR